MDSVLLSILAWEYGAMNVPDVTKSGIPSWYVIVVDLISKVGFPIVVAGYLLTRYDSQMQALIEACSKR